MGKHIKQASTIDEAMRILVPELSSQPAGKQFLNILSEFCSYHGPVIGADSNGCVDPNATIYNDGMRNVYRFIRSYIPERQLPGIEHGVYSHNQRQKEGDSYGISTKA